MQTVFKLLLRGVMNKVFLSLGSNIDCRRDNLFIAIESIKKIKDTTVSLESSIYETAPLHNTNQGFFLNQIIQINTNFSPKALLLQIKKIESSMGRLTKDSHNMPRTIDIDILAFEELTLLSEDLIIPHPRILDRRFVLEPWKEIAPGYIISGQRLSIKELYNKYLGNRFKNQKVEIINY